MSVEQKRDQVLEEIYERLLDGELDTLFDIGLVATQDGKKVVQRQTPLAQLVATMENARMADKEIEQKKAEAAQHKEEADREFAQNNDNELLANANKDIDRREEMKRELLRAAATVGTSVLTTVIWGAVFTHELRATRAFEIDGTEVSAAGRWLKNSFPKPRVF